MRETVIRTIRVDCPEGLGAGVHTGIFRAVPISRQKDFLILQSESCNLEPPTGCNRICLLGTPGRSPLSVRYEEHP